MAHIEANDITLTYDTPSGAVPGVRGVSFRVGGVGISSASSGRAAAASRRCSISSPDSSRRTPAKSASPASRCNGYGMDRGIVFQDFAQLFPWRTALGNVAFGLEMKGMPKAERETIALEQLAPGEAGEIRPLLSAPSVRRHAAAGRDRARAGLQSGGAADGRAVRGARRLDPRRHAAASRRCVADDAQDGDLRDPQCRRSGLISPIGSW